MTRILFSSQFARLSPILLGTWLALPGCSSKVEMGQAGNTGGTGGGSTGSATGGVTAVTGMVSYAGSNSNNVGGATVATTSAVSSFQLQRNTRISGIDLLLMIDNSQSMADKQTTLAAAVPQLLGQLVQPNCVDSNGGYIGPSTLGSATPCASGKPEFTPINNIHIGVVTSSLGDHGANTICTPGAATSYTDANGNQILQPADVNDKAHLMGTLDRAAAVQSDPQTAYATLDSLGFLAWGDATLPTPGATDLAAATKIFTDLVTATHENGCGYESQLESWFRFLIDPVPPVLPLATRDAQNMTHRTGSDDALLNQRAAFLRPDSLVAVVMLTDENDCSIRDTDVGWVAATTSVSITTSSSQCASNPNDKCCYSCTSSPPAGCTNGCANPPGVAANDGPYQANIRCWNQKRRFGYEFLYPTSRYVVGLTNPQLCPDQTFGDMDCNCTYAKSIGAGCDPGSRRMPNPLYSTVVGTLNNGSQIQGYPSAVARSDNSLVFLTGILGVPWQDIGNVDSSGNLNYIPVTDPAWTGAPSDATDTPANPRANGGAGIWDMIYGKDAANIVPKDVHMVESIVPRNGLPGPTAAANADPFNGHEYNTALEDLEYACIYPLPTSRPCQCDPATTNYASCKYQHPNDCCDTSYKADGQGGPGGDFDKPVCNATTQVAAKAYPGLREIEVLHDYAVASSAPVQGNSVVASICPKDLSSDPSSPGYGYNPAMATLIDRIKMSLKATAAGSCLPKPITAQSDGTVPCRVVEAIPPSALNGASCASFCNANQRSVYSGGSLGSSISDPTVTLRNAKICDTTGGVACSDMCLCQLNQEAPGTTALTACQNDPDGASTTSAAPGYCYVDPDNGIGTNSDLVSQCPTTERRILRFVGNNPTSGISVPLSNSYVLTYCAGQ